MFDSTKIVLPLKVHAIGIINIYQINQGIHYSLQRLLPFRKILVHYQTNNILHILGLKHAMLLIICHRDQKHFKI